MTNKQIDQLYEIRDLAAKANQIVNPELYDKDGDKDFKDLPILNQQISQLMTELDSLLFSIDPTIWD